MHLLYVVIFIPIQNTLMSAEQMCILLVSFSVMKCDDRKIRVMLGIYGIMFVTLFPKC